MNRHDADHVVGVLDDNRFETIPQFNRLAHLVERVLVSTDIERIDLVTGHHHEQCCVERIDALPDDLALRAALPAAGEKSPGVLEKHAVRRSGERLARRQRLAIARIDVGEALHRNQLLPVDAVLPRREEVQASSDKIGLKTCLFAQRHESRSHGAAEAPDLFDHAVLVILDIDDDPGPLVGHPHQHA